MTAAIPHGWKVDAMDNGAIQIQTPSGGMCLCKTATEADSVREAVLHQLCTTLLVGSHPPEAEPMTERDHFDFARWHAQLGVLARAHSETRPDSIQRRQAWAALMFHACQAATGWRARSHLEALGTKSCPAAA